METDVTDEQIEALGREGAALSVALAAARRVRCVLLAAFVVAVAAIAWAFYQKAQRLAARNNLERLMDVAQDRFESNRDFYDQELQKLVDRVAPATKISLRRKLKRLAAGE